MNAAQNAKLWKLIEANRAHHVTEHRTPVEVVLRCTCGWRRSFTRSQNAMGRVAKMNAAHTEHLASLNPS